MRSKSIFVFFVVVFLVSCASPAPQPTATVVPSSTHTALPTSTEMLEPTPTAPSSDEQGGGEGDVEEVGKVNMTWEDWNEKVFVGKYTGGNGKEYSYQEVLSEYSETFTDPDQVRLLPPGTPMILLGADGVIQCISDPGPAADLVVNGATVLVQRVDGAVTPSLLCFIAIKAAVAQFAKGEQGLPIRVTFGENQFVSQPISIGIQVSDIVTVEVDGQILSPVVSQPLHYTLYNSDIKEEMLPSTTDPDLWMQEAIELGFTHILIWPTQVEPEN